MKAKEISYHLDKLTLCDNFVFMYFTARFVTDLIDFARSKGIDENDIWKQSGHAPLQVKSVETVDYDVIVDLLSAIKNILNREDIGLLLGEEMGLAATRYIDQMMDYSPTLEQAFENAARFSMLISDAMQCRLETKGDRYSLYYDLNPNWALKNEFAVKQVLDLALVCSQKSMLRLTGQHYFPLELNLFYSRPKRVNPYYRLFNCRVNFGRTTSSIVFQKHPFSTEVKSFRGGMLEELKQRASEEIEQLKTESSLVFSIKKLLLQDLTNRMSLEQVAESIHASPRTIQRKLSKENTSFHQIDEYIRTQMAVKYLDESDRSIDEISYLLGYSESSSFIRAFGKARGISPYKYKIEQQRASLENR